MQRVRENQWTKIISGWRSSRGKSQLGSFWWWWWGGRICEITCINYLSRGYTAGQDPLPEGGLGFASKSLSLIICTRYTVLPVRCTHRKAVLLLNSRPYCPCKWKQAHSFWDHWHHGDNYGHQSKQAHWHVREETLCQIPIPVLASSAEKRV